jgi:hypothetical protein
MNGVSVNGGIVAQVFAVLRLATSPGFGIMALAGGESRNHAGGALSRFSGGSAHGAVLRSIGTTPAGMPMSDAPHATKQRWKCAASRVATMSPKWLRTPKDLPNAPALRYDTGLNH